MAPPITSSARASRPVGSRQFRVLTSAAPSRNGAAIARRAKPTSRGSAAARWGRSGMGAPVVPQETAGGGRRRAAALSRGRAGRSRGRGPRSEWATGGPRGQKGDRHDPDRHDRGGGPGEGGGRLPPRPAPRGRRGGGPGGGGGGA